MVLVTSSLVLPSDDFNQFHDRYRIHKVHPNNAFGFETTAPIWVIEMEEVLVANMVSRTSLA
jgi:hypothetical protein